MVFGGSSGTPQFNCYWNVCVCKRAQIPPFPCSSPSSRPLPPTSPVFTPLSRPIPPLPLSSPPCLAHSPHFLSSPPCLPTAGEGPSGTVYRAKWRGTDVAVKILRNGPEVHFGGELWG